MPHKIGILLVTYNQIEKTRSWIEKFYSNGFNSDNTRLLVLDNNSEDSTFSILQREFPDLDIRLLNDNYGPTVGRNIGISELFEMGCDTYFGFDPDVQFNEHEYFQKSICFLDEHPDLDGFTPILRWYEDLSIQGLGGRKSTLGVMKTVREITDNHSVHFIPGGSSVIKMTAFHKYGIYDNDLAPVGAEDYEWGYRMSKLGGKLEYNPDLEVIHFHEKTAQNTNLTQKRWIFISRAIFLRKHFSFGHLLRELMYFNDSLITFDLRYIISSYMEGMRKKLNPDSCSFATFLEIDRTQFYSNQNQPD